MNNIYLNCISVVLFLVNIYFLNTHLFFYSQRLLLGSFIALGTYPASLFEKDGRRALGGYPEGELPPIDDEKPVLAT